MTHASVPTSNQLIAALPADDLKRWLLLLETVELPLGSVVCEAGRSLDHVYFPTTAIVGLLNVTGGDTSEIAVVGSEGFVGISLLLGGETSTSRAVVQSAGQGYRIGAQAIKAEFVRSASVKDLLLRYTQALITQMAQTAVCNRHHTLDQQLCRLLLTMLDRLHGNELTMTQQLTATLLGVRRGGVTEAAIRLQHAGLIRYARGHVAVLDRAGLEARSCECYSVVRKEYERLLPNTGATGRPDKRGT